MKNLISNYASVNVGLEINLETKSAFGRNLRGKSIYAKPIFNYRFSSVDQMMAWLDKDLARRLEIKAHEVARREEKKRALENNPYCVGDVMYDSWGYDQTNIDFYQIVEVKPKSVILRAIASSYVKGSEGFMCANVKPIKDYFVGEPILKKIVTSVNYSGNISYHISAKHGCFCNFIESKEEKGVYSSWYA